jgi:DNA-binding transcriptional LysR family regulator
MSERVTLDQLRTFTAVVREGSFSAAARKLRRVQSAVSHAIGNLEKELEVKLFDRTEKTPSLTNEGRVLLAAAESVLERAGALELIAGALSGGAETSVSIAVDAVFPLDALVEVCREFRVAHPAVALTVETEALSAVSAKVSTGVCQLGIVGPAADTHGLEKEYLSEVRMIPVVAPSHPLAEIRGKIASPILREHVQVVLSARGDARGEPDRGVLSPNTWRVADLETKHRLLLGGLGFGNLPEHRVREDLKAKRLVEIRPRAWSEDEHVLSLSAVYKTNAALGPAARWLLERLGSSCENVNRGRILK